MSLLIDTRIALQPHWDTAEIPIEEAKADVLLVAGGDDAMWPSLPFAERLVVRRRTAGRTARLISRAEAGHRPRLPGEGPASPRGSGFHACVVSRASARPVRA
ncbi:acyl-CoA thioester hydrolase/BAAT C-terminal domain-containing protein [Nonomuraea sp. H19]|uniref:acyl-CoA thioester hydrolase/BAAT C-terminal domain-containing protein n=1 Tax=Nonomuraea sp. H19 TaxID=3452206 RepID=UPI003F8ABFF1